MNSKKSPERELAIAAGKLHYLTGRPCKRGHIAPRSVTSYRCLECHRIFGGKWLKDNPDKTSIAGAKWRKNNPEKARANTLDWNKKNIKLIYERNAEWQRSHPIEHSAHNKVYRAKKSGELKLQPCQQCGSQKDVHAHHKDYSKPLDVTWFCRSCHSLHHWEIRKTMVGDQR